MARQSKPEGSTPQGLSSSERDAFRKRASELGEKLERHRSDYASPKRAKSSNSAFGQALKMAIEPVVGVLFGLFVGLGLDTLLGTKPVMLIAFLLLGAAAGMSNLIRSALKTSAGNRVSEKNGGSDTEPGN